MSDKITWQKVDRFDAAYIGDAYVGRAYTVDGGAVGAWDTCPIDAPMPGDGWHWMGWHNGIDVAKADLAKSIAH